MACVLCGGEGQTDRLCGLDVCASCRLGGIDAGLERWHLSLDHQQWEEVQGRRGNTWVEFTVEARVHLSAEVDARASFRREGPLDRAAEWLRGTEPQGGDPLFDRMVFVADADGAMLPRLVRDEGVQAALMELVPQAAVALDGRSVLVRLEWDDRQDVTPDPMATIVALVLLAVHIEAARLTTL